MLTSLSIENFTAFSKAEFEFVPGINVLLGANASGKTHVLKLAYALQRLQSTTVGASRDVLGALMNTFRPESVSDLIRGDSTPRSADIAATWEGLPYSISITDPAFYATAGSPGHQTVGMVKEGQLTGTLIEERPTDWEGVTEPVFIPVKDMLAHSVGFLSLYDQRHVDFDETHRSSLVLALLPTLRESGRKQVTPLLDKLAEKLEGRVEVRGERFYINGESGRFEMHLVAEGWRKLALLYQLLANGSIAPGTVLYWDEPEANLNPSMFPAVAEILAMLAGGGTQLHIATHSYAMLREIEFAARAQSCTLRLFGLDRTAQGVAVSAVERFVDLKPNPILDEYERLYGLSVKEALRGG